MEKILKVMKSLLGLFRSSKSTKELKVPSYGKVFTTLTNKEMHDAFIAYEVLVYAPSQEHITHKNGVKTLKAIAASHNWDFSSFLDIIADEYDCLHNK